MTRLRPLAVSVFAALAIAAPAQAADPIMPLSDVRAGMECTSLSVVKGIEPASFDVRIEDVVEGAASPDGTRILFSASGPAIDATGIGPGFSGSPIYCPNAEGVPANVGAISEGVGEYGGKVGLATPIESILGTPPDAPVGASRRPGMLRRARSLASPITISGLSRPLSDALARISAKRGKTRVLAAPAGPLKSFPPQSLRPGSAMGVGYSSGAIAAGAVGTVSYVDGDRLWGFGHPLDGVGRRNLLLQDAYVYKVINNPVAAGSDLTTYKLAASSHDVGTISNDALSAVAGRLGGLPRTVPVRVTVRDKDTGRVQTSTTQVADETDIDDPVGTSLVSFVAPIAVTEAASAILRSVPGQVTGDMCIEIAVRELSGPPMRFCNRYVGTGGGFGNAVASGAGSDASTALGIIAAYTGRRLHITSVDVGVRMHRGAELAYMRELRLPSRVRRGRTVTARLVVQRLRERREVRRVRIRIPRDVSRGSQRVILRGTEPDASGDELFETIIFELDGEERRGSSDGSALDEGPQSLRELREEVEGLRRYDGVELYVGRVRGEGRRVLRDPEVRLAGRVSDRVRVVR